MSRIVELINDEGEALSPLTSADIVTCTSGKTVEQMMSEEKTEMYTPTVECSHTMFKAGQGDTVDYSTNVVNGAYESMVLKGKSMVNCIQEPSSQDVVLPYEFEDGQYVTINDTKENGALGVELKGQTLVNIHQRQRYELTQSTETIAANKYKNIVNTENNVSFEMIDNGSYGWGSYVQGGRLDLDKLKPNTKYLVYFRVATFPDYFMVSFREGNGSKLISTQTRVDKGANYAIVTTTNEIIKGSQLVYVSIPQQSVGHYEFKDIMVIEYQDGMENWDIPYIEGMASCKMPILNSVNQLFDYSLITAPVVSAGGSLSFTNDGRKIRVDFSTRRDCYQHVDLTIPSGTYNVSFEVRGNLSSVSNMETIHSSKVGLAFVGESNNGWSGNAPKIDKQYVKLSQSEFTTVTKSFTFNESKKVTIYYHGWNDNPVGWCEFRNIRIVPQGKSSILSLPEEVVLRSLPNGVRDTFNTRTGVYTQRIGEVFLNGSERWSYNPAATDKTLGLSGFNLSVETTPDRKWYGATLCDKMPVITSLDKVGVYNGQGLNILIKSDSTNVNTLKEILAKDPITVQYQLENPIVTKINLPSTLKSWNTTTHIYSEIPENTLYPTLSHSNPTYPVILKPSTKYSIVANSYSNNHTNSAINFNLGGATASTTVGNRITTITTPSTLSNELLTMSGRGNKLSHVMVIEGGVVGDEPYFEGICDCESPILSNVGANIFDFKTYQPYKASYANGYPYQLGDSIINYLEELENGFVFTTPVSTNHQGACYYVKVKRNTDYYISCDVAFTGTYAVKVLGMYANEIPLTTAIKEGYRHLLNRDNLSANTFQGKFNTRDFDCLFVYLGGAWEETVTKAKTITFTNIQIKELQTPYEPYKSNILSANGDKIELTEDMFEQGTVLWTNPAVGTHLNELKSNVSNRIRLKGVLKAKPNTVYSVTSNDPSNDYWYLPLPLDSNMCKTNYTGNSWIKNGCVTTTSDTAYLTFVIKKEGEADIAVSEFSKLSFELSEVDKTIVLRSLPNGVCDTLNVETGEYVQRIGEVVFNGSESWSVNNSFDTKTTKFFFIYNQKLPEGVRGISTLASHYASSNYFSRANANYRADAKLKELECVMGGDGATGMIQFYIKQSRLSSPDLTGFKQWLSQNPTTVQYVLETPIVKTVDLSGYPFAYKNGHVILSSGAIEQSLTPKVEYALPINRTGQIEQNTKQVIRHDQVINDLESRLLSQLVDSRYKLSLLELDYELSLF